jgi:lytic murein transglycosylase
MKKQLFAGLIATALSVGTAQAQQCGGDFGQFVQDLRTEAQMRGHPQSAIDAFFVHASYSQRAIDADRRQGIFTVPFTEFSRRLISQNRIDNGRRNAERWRPVFDEIERRFGVSRGILLSFWAFETDFGAFQGDYNTLDALVTLAHDCRRPHIFRPQIFAALTLFEHGDFDPVNTQGAWAGEIGMVQMLPEDIVNHGIDGDGDGHVYLQTSAPDALMSGANILSSLGWRPNEPWLIEVTLPDDLDWYRDRHPHLAKRARLGGGGCAHVPGATCPCRGAGLHHHSAGAQRAGLHRLSEFQRALRVEPELHLRPDRRLFRHAAGRRAGLRGRQPGAGARRELHARVAEAAGRRAAMTSGPSTASSVRARAMAVREEQRRLGLPADAWPTFELLNAL